MAQADILELSAVIHLIEFVSVFFVTVVTIKSGAPNGLIMILSKI